jgi:hypothetical protein
MKSAYVLAAFGAIMLGSTSIATAQETQQSAQPSARAKMAENANASAQSSTDVSYGGVPDTRSASGRMRSTTCATPDQCDLSSKH